MKQSRLIAGGVLVIALTFLALCGANCRSRELLDQERATVAKLIVEREGLQTALLVKPKEVIKFVEKLVPIETARLVKTGAVRPVAAGKIEGTKVIDLPLVFPDPPKPVEGEEPPPAPKTTPVTFGVAADFLITKIRNTDDVDWEASLEGNVLMEGMEEPLDFPFEDIKVDIRVSKDIVASLTAHEKEGGWWKRHTGLVCPGVGLSYDLYDRHTVPAVSCTYGLTWF